MHSPDAFFEKNMLMRLSFFPCVRKLCKSKPDKEKLFLNQPGVENIQL